MSLFVFAGAAQLAMIPLISAGASAAMIVLTVLVINLRMALYSASPPARRDCSLTSSPTKPTRRP